jgi:hypothetical protein
VVADRHQPFFTVDALSVFGNRGLQRKQLLEAAMHVTDRVNGGGPGMKREAWMRPASP